MLIQLLKLSLSEDFSPTFLDNDQRSNHNQNTLCGILQSSKQNSLHFSEICLSIVPQQCCMLFISVSTVICQDASGLLLFLFPSGVQYMITPMTSIMMYRNTTFFKILLPMRLVLIIFFRATNKETPFLLIKKTHFLIQSTFYLNCMAVTSLAQDFQK